LRRNKWMLSGLVLTLFAFSAGETWGYSTDLASIRNSFTVMDLQPDIRAVLTEPSWQPEKGLLLLPGQSVPKDPMIENISGTNSEELAAIRISFLYSSACPFEEWRGSLLSEEDMKLVAEVFEIDYNADRSTPGWFRFDGETKESRIQHFYYGNSLKRNAPGRGDMTSPLFTAVKVPSAVAGTQYSRIQEIGGFDLKVEGCVLERTKDGDCESAEKACHSGCFRFSD